MAHDDLDLEALKALLLDQRAQIEVALVSGEEVARPVELDQSRVGRVSRMDALQNQAMAQESDRRWHAERRRIDAALERMDQGEYGDCLRCGQRIASERLRVDPAATLCLGCANAAEAGGS